MTDHEAVVLLVAKQLTEPLSAAEQTDLDEHLAGCPACRSVAAGMRRDDAQLRAELVEVGVSPSVRQRVLDEAKGRRLLSPRLLLALAAALVLGAAAVPLLVGGGARSSPSPSVTRSSGPADALSSAPPSSPAAGSAVARPGLSAAPSAPRSFVSGAYVYGETPPRRDTVSAELDGRPIGEWSRRIPATGPGDSFGGPITCFVISGSDAWLAGPATTATDGSTDHAVLIYLHDGGPNGLRDRVVMWLSTPGQTLTTMTGWCETRFIPADPYALTSGDVVVHDASR